MSEISESPSLQEPVNDTAPHTKRIETQMANPVDQTDDKPFPFMQLPAEMRTMIYKELLVANGLIVARDSVHGIYVGEVDDPEDLWRSRRLPQRTESSVNQATLIQLFAVSKQIYLEAVPVYFHYNVFYFYETSFLASFLSQIGPHHRRHLHAIIVHHNNNRKESPAKAMKLLSRCEGLRKLTILVAPYMVKAGKANFLDMWGLKDLLKVRGIEQLNAKNLSPPLPWGDGGALAWEQFQDALQVLKQPHSAAQLKKQGQRDYP